MFLEVHLLQNFALSNLNRDDTGAPKTCIFGGSRRARISSQCLKRAVRVYFREEALVPAELLSSRTKLLQRALCDRLAEGGMAAETARQVATKALELLKLKLKNDKTEYLLMLGEQEINQLATLCQTHAEALLSQDSSKKEKKSESPLPQLLLDAIDGGEAVDMALFGRMIATHPTKNVDAAVQMAHAFSTHAVSTEFDFYAAVDDLQREEDDAGAGAGMLGTTLYNSSCYYRYANVDLNQLVRNLGGDTQKVELAVRAFVEGCIHAVPSGKQTGSGAQNPPGLIMLVVREKGLWSMANAFVQPVFASVKENLLQLSADRLSGYWNDLVGLYGTDSIRFAGLATHLATKEHAPEGVVSVATAPALIEQAMRTIAAAQN